MIYLDSAAVVKLAHAEPESGALRRWLDERAATGWDQLGTHRNRSIPGAGPVRTRRGLPPARRAGPDRPDRSGLAYPAPGPGRRAGHGAQPECCSPPHGPVLPPRADLVRDLRQAAPGRGADGRSSRRFARADRNRRYRHRAEQWLWLVGLPASAASAGHDAQSAAPWTRGLPVPARRRPCHPNAAGMAAVRRTRPRRADRGSQGGTFGLRTDYGISPQLTCSADFWHPTGSAAPSDVAAARPRRLCHASRAEGAWPRAARR